MEEPEDAPPLPPPGGSVDDDDVLAVQRSGLHNVSNTCYLNATVQVKTFFQEKAFYDDTFERPVFVFVVFLRQTLKRARLA
jgi:uncharacterized UBP type Zn finger protein